MSTPSGVAGGGKLCSVCGEDVSARPRTKDKHGRYFCTPCYERAIAAKHAKHEAAPLPKARLAHVTPALVPNDARAPSRTAKPRAQPKPAEPQVDEPNILEGLLDLEGPAAAPAMICPSCRSSIPAGGIVCTMCGYNLQTGDSVKHTRVKMQREAGGVVWPATVGIISMVLGGGGVVVYGLYLLLAVLGALQAGVLGAALVSVIPVGSLLTSLAAWLFRDGYRILRRNPDGVKWIRFWAMAKLLIYGSCFGILMSAPVRSLDESLEQLPGLEGQMTGADIKTTILLVMLWFLAWPIFVMVFFFIPRIQDDVEAWD
jgi:hypothetical protein